MLEIESWPKNEKQKISKLLTFVEHRLSLETNEEGTQLRRLFEQKRTFIELSSFLDNF